MKTSSEICFVCGSKGASSILYTRPHEGCPYFSFLDSHIPPRGAHRPTVSGAVSACSVCCAFLNQQWDAFERTRTPLVKRLYWLKRVDNGTFTGAEMSVQGEYMAQLMGLHGIGTSPCGASLFSGGNQTGISCGPDDAESVTSDVAGGALDLSISPRKLELKVKKSGNKSQPHRLVNGARRKGNGALSDSVVCYICGVVCPSSLARFIYAIKHSSDEPHFPFVLALSAPPGAMPVTKTGVTRVCSDCRKSLTRQWRVFEARGVDERDRTYKVGNGPVTSELSVVADDTVTVDAKSSVENHKEAVCYICAEPELFCNMKLVSTRDSLDAEMVLPFVAQLKSPNGARPVSSDGHVSICLMCYDHLEEQWRQFEVNDVPLASRSYSLRSYAKRPERLQCSSDSKLKLISDNGLSAFVLKQSNTDLIISSKGSRTSGLLDNWDRTGSVNCVASNCSLKNDVSTDENRHKVSNLSKASNYCSICDVKCNGNLLNGGLCYKLFSRPEYSSNEKYPVDSKLELSIPFFPFLEQHKHASVVNSVSSQRCVDVCAVCYWHLIRQWQHYEQSNVAEEQNRWKRSYQCRIIPCDICQAKVDRTEITIISSAEVVNELRKGKDRVALVCRVCYNKNGIYQRSETISLQLATDRQQQVCKP
jgi:hypothetical protein